MKNPYMSLWLSQYHTMANAAKGQMMAEASRQQSAMMQAMTEAWVEAWMKMWFPWMDVPKKGRRR